MNKPDDKPEPAKKAGNNRDEQFWRAMRPEVPAPHSEEPVELNADPDDLTEEERSQRRRALRSMLDANEARQRQIKRSRPPTLVAGAQVAIKSGPHRGKSGTVLDADFIHGRALIDLSDGENGHWVEFARVTGDNPGSS